MSFRSLQALMDLRRAAIRRLEQALPEPSPLYHDVLLRLKASVAGRDATWALDLPEETYRDIHLKVASVEADDPAFLTATCLLLLDRFDHPERGSDFLWEWDAFANRFRAADAPTRAAIMNGLAEGRAQELIAEEVCPSIADCTTREPEEVLLPLYEVARTLTPEERKEIAHADYGCDVARHLSALNDLLASKDCLYPPGEYWFPAEVVELVSHVPSSPGFVGCTAILLINAIADGDRCGYAEFRWEQNGHKYGTLNPAEKSAISNGFRHIYETVEHFDPELDEVLRDKSWADCLLPL